MSLVFGHMYNATTGLEVRSKDQLDSTKMVFYLDVTEIRDKILSLPDGSDKWVLIRYRWRNQDRFDSPNEIPAHLAIHWFKNHKSWLRDPLSQDDLDLAQRVRDNWGG